MSGALADGVWITHAALGPAHDQKVPRSSLGSKVAQGWVERADQADPVVADEPADPRPGRGEPTPESPAPSGIRNTPSPAPRKES